MAEAAAATPAPAGGAPAPGSNGTAPDSKGSTGASTPPPPTGATPADGSPKTVSDAPGTPGEDPEAQKRLNALATEQRKFERSKKAWETAQKETIEKAARWDKIQEAKTSKGRVAALREVYEEGEITGELYQELTELIYNTAPGTMTKAEAEELVQKKLDAARKADADASKKAAEDAKAAEAASLETSRENYVAAAFSVYDAAKYPTLERLKAAGHGLKGRDIADHAEKVFAEKGAMPSPAEVLQQLEEEKSKALYPAQVEGTPGKPLPTSVTGKWSNDSPVTPEKQGQTLEEIHEEAKRAALKKRAS